MAEKDLAPQQYEKGLQAYEKGDLKEALIHLKNAIQQDGDYLVAHVLLGKVLLEGGDAAGAEKELSRAMRMGADHALVLVPLADALFIQNKYQEVVDLVSTKSVSKDVQYELLVRRGDTYIKLNDLKKARAEFEQAQSTKQDSAKAYLGLAQVMISEERLGEAETQVSRALDFDSNSSRAWELMAKIRYAQGSLQKAAEYYDKSVVASPENINALLGRASLNLELGMNELVEKDLAVLKKEFPRDPRGMYLNYSFLKKTGKKKEAQEVLTSVYAFLEPIDIKNLQRNSTLLMLAAMTALDIEQYEKAHDYLSIYVRLYPGVSQAQKLFGRVLMAQQLDRDAVEVLETARLKNPNDYELLTLLGTAYANIHLYAKADEILSLAVKRHGGTTARLQRAINDLNFGREDDARQDFNLLFEKAKDPRAGFMLLSLYFREGKMEDAEVIGRKLVAIQSENLIARNMLAVALIENGKLGEAEKQLRHILSSDESFFPAQMNLAKISAMQDKLDEAGAILNELEKQNRNMATVYIAKSQLARKRGEANESIRLAEKAYDEDKANISALTHLIETYLSNRNFEKALAIASEGSVAFPESIKMMELLGNAYNFSGKPDRARSVYRDIAKLASYDTRLLFRLARLQYEAGDVDGGIWSLRKAIEGDENFEPARVVLVESLISLDKLEEAEKLIETLRQSQDQAQYHRLRGDWYTASGKFTSARKSYNKALEVQPSEALTLKLFGAYKNEKNNDEARRVLEAWIKTHPDSIQIRAALAQELLSINELDSAAEHYEAIIKRNPKHAQSLNNLANIYLINKDIRALELARRAHEQEPDRPDFNDTLGWILVSSGSAEEGLRFLRNAHARASANPEVGFHIAVALEKMGRKDEAVSQLRNILEKSVKFPQRKDAEKMLHRLQP
ncbi:MAG: PEP-CTERM system TPR-repeat protein PrsT [Gammaproteobacteria bacterium]|nr:PEP-CTERM system TPR-repeat protein PrsT [Gammaproteobacteria bacterium]